MSENGVLARFCKSGDLNHLTKIFHKLDRDQKEYAIALIQDGMKPEKAVELARIRQVELF